MQEFEQLAKRYGSSQAAAEVTKASGEHTVIASPLHESFCYWSRLRAESLECMPLHQWSMLVARYKR